MIEQNLKQRKRSVALDKGHMQNKNQKYDKKKNVKGLKKL